MARTRNPQYPTIETDPAKWGPFAACRDRNDLDWFDPDDDADDLDLSLVDDRVLEVIAAMKERTGVLVAARGAEKTGRNPIDELLAEDLNSELDQIADREIQPTEDADGWDADPALVLCNRCPVAAHCLEWALEWNFTTGIFGGYTPEQREQIRRDRHLPSHGTRTGYSVHNCHCPLCSEAAAVAQADRRDAQAAAELREKATAAA